MKILKGINFIFIICEKFPLIVVIWNILNSSDFNIHFLKIILNWYFTEFVQSATQMTHIYSRGKLDHLAPSHHLWKYFCKFLHAKAEEVIPLAIITQKNFSDAFCKGWILLPSQTKKKALYTF